MNPGVMVVDDEAMFLEVASFWLEEAGLGPVRQCLDAAEALTALAESPVSCVVLDLHLGARASGLELLPRFAREAPQVPVILVSADSGTEWAVEALLKGAFVYWRKAARPDELIQAVRLASEECRSRRAGGCKSVSGTSRRGEARLSALGSTVRSSGADYASLDEWVKQWGLLRVPGVVGR